MPAPEAPRLVAMVAFPGGNLIDIAGPLQAFASAAELAPEGTATYRLLTVSEAGGPVTTAPGSPSRRSRSVPSMASTSTP